MLSARIEVRAAVAIHHLAIDDRPLTLGELLSLIAEHGAAREWLVAHLAALPNAAFFLELPPVMHATLERPAELAIVDAPALARTAASPASFEAHLAGAGGDVVAFSNLGGDALLVVPTERGPRAAYGHLAAFVRAAPAAQRSAFFQRAAQEARARISAAPLWISTAGMGVPWLHLRLDQQPKYYRHAPYRRA